VLLNLAADRFPLEQLTIPTLLISARDDHIAPYRSMGEFAAHRKTFAGSYRPFIPRSRSRFGPW
jgi:poly(3-hydroxyalkanoate) synthetase